MLSALSSDRAKLNFSFCRNIFFLACIYSVCIFFLACAVGGVDLVAYKNSSSVSFEDWDSYFYKEFFSWLIIKFSFYVSNSLGLMQPVLMVNFSLLILYLFFTRGMKLQRWLIPLVLISPLSILLCFNVLRQYVSVFLVSLALLNILNGNLKTFFLLSVLAFFSHQSIIFLIALILMCRFFSFYAALIFLLVSQFFVLIVNMVYGFGLYSDQGYDEVGELLPFYKVLSHFAYVVFLFLMLKFLGRLCGGLKFNSVFLDKVINSLMGFSVLIIVFPWPAWISNRLLINVSFVYLFLFFNFYSLRKKYKFVFLLSFCLLNIAAIILHGGALSMLDL
jgi:hypothetical protein